MSQKKCNKGFTLIELIVVIAIIGILALVAVPRVTSIFESAKLRADQATVRTLNSVTLLARMSLFESDPFMDDEKSDEELIEFLVEGGYLDSKVEAKVRMQSLYGKMKDGI